MCHEKKIQYAFIKYKFFSDAVISNFKGNMHPSRNLSVDETMVGFRGHYGAKQYIPTKPNKYGIKAFTQADSENEYILELILYQILIFVNLHE